VRLLWLLALLPAAVSAQTVVIYSRTDTQQAQRAHALASVYGPASIDRNLPPGVAWRPAIAADICAARVVLLVWSERAAASAEVRREIDTALLCRVLIVPVLLDSAPLPGVVADVNAVDWR
jgi:TIR domain